MSPATQNMAIESFLGLMVLLLVMSLVAIVRMPAMTGSMSASVPDAEDAPLGWTADPSTAAGGVAPPARPMPVAGPRIGTESQAARRGRYQARHVRGYVPPSRHPQGPPWEQAQAPPG